MMKRITLMVCLLTSIATYSAYAVQDAGGGKYMQKLTSELNLSADQQSKIKAIMMDNRAKMKQERDNVRQQVRATLTPEQQTKFDAMKASHMHKHYRDAAASGN
jgi:Spy/CpxP family protein refolding chaperone